MLNSHGLLMLSILEMIKQNIVLGMLLQLLLMWLKQLCCLPTATQQAERYALMRACILANSKTVNINTDRRPAFGVVHDFGML